MSTCVATAAVRGLSFANLLHVTLAAESLSLRFSAIKDMVSVSFLSAYCCIKLLLSNLKSSFLHVRKRT